MLALCRQEEPEVEIRLFEVPLSQQIKGLHDDLYDVGVVATVEKMLRVPDGSMRVLIHGGERVRLLQYPSTEPVLVAQVDAMPDLLDDGDELKALAGNVAAQFARIVDLVPYLPDELQMAAANLEDPSTLSYLVASSLRVPVAEKQELLEEIDVAARLRRLSGIAQREIQVLELGARIQAEVNEDIEKVIKSHYGLGGDTLDEMVGSGDVDGTASSVEAGCQSWGAWVPWRPSATRPPSSSCGSATRSTASSRAVARRSSARSSRTPPSPT